jgi:hypothetical protein
MFEIHVLTPDTEWRNYIHKVDNFGKFWGSLGIVLAALLFARDMWSAPHPAEPDISPISFVWFIGTGVKMLLFARRSTLGAAGAGMP